MKYSCSVTKSCLTLCDPHRLQHTGLLCLSLCLRICSDSCPLSQWCYLTISSFAALFSFCLQSFPASWSFPVKRTRTLEQREKVAHLQNEVIHVKLIGMWKKYSITFKCCWLGSSPVFSFFKLELHSFSLISLSQMNVVRPCRFSDVFPLILCS